MLSVSPVRSKFMIIGAVILTLIGSAWCIAALAFWRAHPIWSIPAASVATLILLALCVLQFRPLRKISAMPDLTAATKWKRNGRLFGIIFAVESLSIFLSATLLAHLGLGIWIPIAIAIIVGLHFIPLARVFETPVYYLTGALCVVGVLGCSLIRNAGT